VRTPSHRIPSAAQALPFESPLTLRLGREFFRTLPQSPGVYFFYDGDGQLLYIGQSSDLRARIGSYRHVTPEKNTKRTLRLVSRLAVIDVQTCDTTAEAVELERVTFESLSLLQPGTTHCRQTGTQASVEMIIKFNRRSL
jgi:predicted GIY-YIG superfamily endonuclease